MRTLFKIMSLKRGPGYLQAKWCSERENVLARKIRDAVSEFCMALCLDPKTYRF